MKRVAVIPLKQFLDARSDSELLTKLATSVERTAVLKYLRAWAAECPEDSATQHAMLNAARDIEQGQHV
jgi:hypothetical protein